MLIVSVQIKSLRNLAAFKWEPKPGLNALVGPNGVGKTSVLEAMSLASWLRSFRTQKLIHCIKNGVDESEIKLEGKDPESVSIEVHLKRENGGRVRKRVALQQAWMKGMTEYLIKKRALIKGGFHSVVFHPQDVRLVYGEPEGRRHYCDRALCAEDPGLLQLFHRYQQLLRHRNALLKNGHTTQSMLQAFSIPFFETGAKIRLLREKWLQDLSPFLNQHWHDMTAKAPITLRYKGVAVAGQENAIPVQEELLQAYQTTAHQLAERELRMQTSLVGPHREDWEWVLDQGSMQTTGSQGEVRAALLALKFAEISTFYKAVQTYPLFLVDDFSSELDQNRRYRLLEALSATGAQVFVSSTEPLGEGVPTVHMRREPTSE